MNHSFLRRLRRVPQAMAAALAMLASSAPAGAQEFPSRPVHMVVPYTAGGSSDSVARLISQKLTEQFGQSVVVENKAGAGATIGTAYAARKGQEGYVALLADNAQTVAPTMYSSLPYDAIGDFHVVGLIGEASAMLFASQASGLKSVQDVLEQSRKQPGSLTIGTGNGSPSHLITELFQIKSGAKLQIVPYKGASAALADLLAGHIDLVFTNPASGAQHLKSGKIALLAQSGRKRDPRFPDAPTFDQAGVAGLDAKYWFAVLVPADTPEPAKERWHRALDAVLAMPDVAAKLDEMGISPSRMTPAQALAMIEQEARLWKEVAQTAGIKAN